MQGYTIIYTLPLLPRLVCYVNNGRFCIENNRVENAIKLLALSGKNLLFCGNYDVSLRSAIVYFLVDSCKVVGVDLSAWMEDAILRILGNENNHDALRDLMPDRWVKQITRSNLDKFGTNLKSNYKLSFI